MALLNIVLYPDSGLRKKSAAVEKIDEGVLRLLDDMAETMKASRGIGLSAPQVGGNIRVALVSDARGIETPVGEKDGNSNADANSNSNTEEKPAPELPVIEMINPVITNASGRGFDKEGCLSIPGFTAKVGRRETVTVEWLTRGGENRSMTVSGLTARIVQHEIDHLDGILFIDRLSRLKKEMLLKRIKASLAAKKRSGNG